MVASYTLARKQYQVNQLFFMTTLNQFEPFFKELKKRLRLSEPLLEPIIDMGEELMEEHVHQVIVKEKVKKINYQSIHVFHDKYDKYDKILPHSYAELLVENVPNAQLYSYEKIGHSKMLQNATLLADFENLVSTSARSNS